MKKIDSSEIECYFALNEEIRCSNPGPGTNLKCRDGVMVSTLKNTLGRLSLSYFFL